MTARFTVLASGSCGNASLLEVNGFGVLIDVGLNPRELDSRLAAIGASWDNVHAAILTHTHTDHWKARTLSALRTRRIPIYAHADHFEQIEGAAVSVTSLGKANLTREFGTEAILDLAPGLTCRPVWVSHDCDPTFAFRFDFHDGNGNGPAWSLGYAADLGCGSEELVDAFAGVEVLAIEYNHDVAMERASRRPAFLVQRVLGDTGHLSNRQAAELTRSIAARSGPAFPMHLVQLHLSQECNHPMLAERAGRHALADLSPAAAVTTARQEAPARSISLGRHAHSARRTEVRPVRIATRELGSASLRPSLPGF